MDGKLDWKHKKSDTTSKNAKTEEKHLNMMGWKEQSNTIRTNDTTQRDKLEGTGEKRKTKKIST